MHAARNNLLLLVLGLFAVWLIGGSGRARGDVNHPTVINLRSTGPLPQTLTIRVGTAVVWVSHLAHTKLVVVTLAFLDGARVAQTTASVEGYNGFALEGEHFVGRMEGNGGKVALRFTTSGTYTYTLGHEPGTTGTVVVRK